MLVRDEPLPLLHYEVHEGQGPFLLLVHGMLSSRAQWRPNLGALGAVCRPVVVELLGHGRSPAPEDGSLYTPDHYVVEFEHLRRRLGVERWVVCGQSLGAALTLRYALEHPERVTAQIFTNSNSALASPEWTRRARPAMQALASRVEEAGAEGLEEIPIHPRHSRHLPRDARAELVADCALHSPLGVARTALYTVCGSSVRERIGSNRVPALLVYGAREDRFAAHARYAQEVMPRLRAVALPAGHAVNLEAADGFDAAVSGFLEYTLPDAEASG